MTATAPMNIRGSMPALVTPMLEDGQIDWKSYANLIEWHIAEGTHGIVVVGTTGESPTVNVDEHCELIQRAVELARGRVPIVAGTGGNSTTESIELTAFAKKAGAQASLVVVPYYNKPTQEGLYQHFKTIAEAVDLPLILYNVPGRTVADMSNDTVVRLAAIPNIVGIKDATGDVGRGIALINAVPKSFSVFSGDDASAVALMLMGGKGNISVTANVAPRIMAQLCEAALAGDIARASALHASVIQLHSKLFVEASPIPVKWALQQMGKIEGGIRLPLVPLSAAAQAVVKDAMRSSGLS